LNPFFTPAGIGFPPRVFAVPGACRDWILKTLCAPHATSASGPKA